MLNDIWTVTHRSIISIIVLFLLTLLMGKQQLAQLTFFDYVAGISIGSIAAALAMDSSINYVKGITGLIIYTFFPIILSLISTKSYRARGFLDSKPTILINKGQIIEKNLRKEKLNINDLLEQCRAKNVFDIADVEFAILETSGNISVELKASSKPLTPRDMNIPTQYRGLCINIVMDGEILQDQLQAIGRDKKWLKKELEKQKISDPRQIILGYLDGKGNLVVQKKE